MVGAEEEQRIGMKLRFVEAKNPDIHRVSELLDECAEVNQWANRGPLYNRLRDQFSRHVSLPEGTELVPMANGGIALESIARLQSLRAGRKLRWVASAFSFWNLGRGYFHDVIFVDCDERGLLDLNQLKTIDRSSYDGIILTNPFGLFRDFAAYSTFAGEAGKHFIIDNASGIHTELPEWIWQAFSLHHTKPYGVGEGGLALVPADDAEEIYSLLNYGEEHHGSPNWLQNGKLSDLSCAFLIDRLERADEWVPGYLEQRARVADIARRLGMRLVSQPETDIPLTSLPLLAVENVPVEAIQRTSYMTLAKYYKPLREFPTVCDIYRRLVNVPCHTDMATLTDGQIESDLLDCVTRNH